MIHTNISSVNIQSKEKIKGIETMFRAGVGWPCLLLTCVLLIGPTMAVSQNEERDTIRLFFLGGQSNMEGHGKLAELPDSLRGGYDNIWIFHGNPAPDEDVTGGLGKWDVLAPGHGAGFSSDGISNTLSDRFGPELSFAKKLRRLYPNEKIALMKYARGGSSLDSLAAREYGSWEMDYKGATGINQLDHYLSMIREAFHPGDIDNNGKDDILIPCGIIWMQGESDACISEEIADRYFGNLKRLMDLLRVSLHRDDVPIAIGKISDSGEAQDGLVWKYGDRVQKAQERFVSADRRAALVRDTQYYQYSDPWHYDSKGYILLGEKFADAIFQLCEK